MTFPGKRFLIVPWWSLCLVLLFHLSTVMAETGPGVEDKEILVIGSGQIFEGNTANAKQAALSNALEKGLEAYLTRRLGQQGMINNFPVLVKDLIPRAREMIENFLILAENQMQGRFSVLVRVKVNDKMMEEQFRALGLVLREGPAIKVLFLVSHLDPMRGEAAYWWKDPENPVPLTLSELFLHKVFEARGFSPINRMFIVPEGSITEEMKLPELSEEGALRWGTMYGADAVIRGKCEILDEALVSVSLSALETRGGKTVAEETQAERPVETAGIVEELPEVINRAVAKVVARIGPEVVAAVEAGAASIRTLEITLTGLKSFREFSAFREFIQREIRGVKSVQQSRVRGNTASVKVEFSGEETAFLDMVTSHENLPFKLETAGKKEGEIIFSVR